MATILIMDAQKEFRAVLQNVLTSYGHEVVTAETGAQALEIMKTTSPTVMLFALALPDAPGIEVLAKIRATAPALPVIVLTGSASTDLESRVREMGVDEVLRKGLKMDIIMQAVNRAFQHAGRLAKRSAAAAEQTDASAGKTGQQETILVVDDEPDICDLVGEFLARRGYQVKTANSGELALEMIQKELPRLVLLDIYMPGVNGVEVVRRLKSKDLLTKLGVIMLTASQEEPLLQEALNLGAFDVLSKPVNLDELELAVAVKLALSAPE